MRGNNSVIHFMHKMCEQVETKANQQETKLASLC